MNYTVLGASGFIGRHLVADLHAAGHQVFAPARADKNFLKQPLGHVLYCIGLTADFRSQPLATMQAHVGVLAHVLEHAQFDSLLYLSSTRVYSGLLDPSGSATEDALLAVNVSDPSELYNLSKLAGEALCRNASHAGVRVARLANIVGHDPDSQNFLTALIQQALRGRIELLSDPASSKDYLLIDDLVKLLPQLAHSAKHWIYNVASGQNLQHRQLAERLVELTGCQLKVQEKPPLQIFPTIDITRLRAEFAFTPGSVLNALPALVERYRRHHAAPADTAFALGK